MVRRNWRVLFKRTATRLEVFEAVVLAYPIRWVVLHLSNLAHVHFTFQQTLFFII